MGADICGANLYAQYNQNKKTKEILKGNFRWQTQRLIGQKSKSHWNNFYVEQRCLKCMQHLYATKQHLWEASNESYMVFYVIIIRFSVCNLNNNHSLHNCQWLSRQPCSEELQLYGSFFIGITFKMTCIIPLSREACLLWLLESQSHNVVTVLEMGYKPMKPDELYAQNTFAFFFRMNITHKFN